jgi:hypothetical protein
MSKEVTVIALGVWVGTVSYLGFPSSWKTIIFIITGALIAIIGFLLRSEALSRGGRHSEHNPFVENLHADKQIPVESAVDIRHDHRERINSLN